MCLWTDLGREIFSKIFYYNRYHRSVTVQCKFYTLVVIRNVLISEIIGISTCFLCVFSKKRKSEKFLLNNCNKRQHNGREIRD